MLGWLLDTKAMTLELPLPLQAILNSVPCSKKRLTAKKWHKVLGKLRSMSVALPGSRGLFSQLQLVLCDLLSTRMTGAHDTFMIKTKNNQWQDNIVNAIRTYITETIFKEDKSTDKAIQKMFSNNLHFGKTHDPNDAPLYTDAQVRLFIKRCDFVKTDGHLIIWIRHTLVFPVDFPDNPIWTAVEPQAKLSPFGFMHAENARVRAEKAQVAPAKASAQTAPTLQNLPNLPALLDQQIDDAIPLGLLSTVPLLRSRFLQADISTPAPANSSPPAFGDDISKLSTICVR
jgi:hypothetical protein